MQNVDRIADVEALPQPQRYSGPRVQDKPLGIVQRAQGRHGIIRHPRRRRHIRQYAPIRSAELQLAVRLSMDLVALLVHGAMVPATEHREIGERRRPSLRPVTNMMPLAEADPTAREAATTISMLQRPP
jgi:hypothetical protein